MDCDRQRVFIGEPEVVEENLGLGAGVVEDQRGAVLAHLFEYRRDRIGRAATGPRRGFLGP